ncbi:uncharacterized protein J4E79_010399 [Alternaria viburni]|uniref:uncharacterized protein n=1 Tax=Alternaria viburni TaxID=566460 RepID=UPI0020C2BAC1|nr:uncharacterized protein J4E79_010399 [Alternaria viburni]KAI4647248.1 hypothetical protein J4E79_010399 [Alternaria viburni]
MSTASDRKRQATLSFSGQGVRLAEDPQPKRKRAPKAKDTRPTKQAAFDDLEYGQDTFNMPGLFQSFKKEEARRSGMVESHIVSPSGYATSLLHLQLHYPTFTTKHLNDGQTLDATNRCIRILIEKGFVASNTYWFEAYFRRLSAASVRHLANVADGWKEEVKQLHDEFAYRCQSLSKKVLLVFGAFNRKRFHERHNVENITVRLSCGSTTLMGIVRNNAQKILFVVVYAWHPEYLLRNRTTAVGRQYDAALNIAAALSGVDTKAGYFEARAARTHEKSGRSPTQRKSTISQPPPSLALVTATDIERTKRAYEVEALKKRPTRKTLRYQRTVSYDKNVPLDNYGLNNQAIIQAAQSDDAFPSGKILSRPTMFAETSNTYFYRPSEAANARQPTTTNSARPSQGSPQGSWVIQPIVSKSKNTLINTAVVHVGRIIKLKCLICGLAPERKPVTDRPEFCTQSHVAGRYIARAQVCTTPSCQVGWNPEPGRSGRRQMMIPQDPTIAYVRSDQLQELFY